MSNTNTGSVLCAACGQPCGEKPYAKDAKGRIICRPCIDARKNRQAGTEADQTNVMSALLAKSKMANAVPCPGCKSYMPKETIICTHCGYNTETGKAITTRVFRAPKQKTKSGGGAAVRNIDPILGVWAMVLLYTALSIGCFVWPSLLLLMYLTLTLHGLIVWVWYIVVAFVDGAPAWGIIMIIPILNILGLYYIFFKSERFILKYHFLTAIGFNILTKLLATSVFPVEETDIPANPARAPIPVLVHQLG